MQNTSEATDSLRTSSQADSRPNATAFGEQREFSETDVREPEVPIGASCSGRIGIVRLTIINGVAVPDTPEDAERLKQQQAEIAANPEKYKNHRWMSGPSTATQS